MTNCVSGQGASTPPSATSVSTPEVQNAAFGPRDMSACRSSGAVTESVSAPVPQQQMTESVSSRMSQQRMAESVSAPAPQQRMSESVSAPVPQQRMSESVSAPVPQQRMSESELPSVSTNSVSVRGPRVIRDIPNY